MYRYVLIVVTLLSLAPWSLAQDSIPDRKDALAAAKAAYQVANTNNAVVDGALAEATLDYGAALLRMYDGKEAQKVLQLALERYETVYGPESPEILAALLLSAQADYTIRQKSSSKSHLERARSLVATSFDQTSIDYADARYNIGGVALATRFTDDAVKDLSAAHEIYAATLDPMSPRLGQSSHFLGTVFLADGQASKAEPLLNMALDIFDIEDPDRRNAHIQVLTDWARGLAKLGATKAALARYMEIGRLQGDTPEGDLLPLVRVAPRYPMQELSKGNMGSVEWQFTVDKQGRVRNPVVLNREGSKRFEKAARDALMKFQYAPRFENGEPVDTPNVTSTITFKIE